MQHVNHLCSREFFYIQMEKYARQAAADGCNHCEELVVNRDSELFRHLNLHYNRNNQIEVSVNSLSGLVWPGLGWAGLAGRLLFCCPVWSCLVIPKLPLCTM